MVTTASSDLSSAGPLTPWDRAEIIELLARYSWALDTNQEDDCAALFAPGGYADVTSGRFSDIRALVRKVNATDWCIGQQHWVGNHIFDGDGNRCTVRSMHFAPRRQDGDHVVVSVGCYVDDLVKIDDAWKFERRWWRPWEAVMLQGGQPWTEYNPPEDVL